MTIRPPHLSSYYDQTGRYGANLWSIMLFWTALVRVLNAIGSLATVPVISALLAQGAVVYCQRRNIKQRLNLRHTFALADRGWTDIAILWDALPWRHSSGSMFLWLAAGLLFVGRSARSSSIRQKANGSMQALSRSQFSKPSSALRIL